ncbi:peroxiredoxin [Cyanobium sp. NIES-981]|uniref:peroxiredoxin n=1 Tax=Cyanobium sp. NIES-981 TaxID=1851505 RepID=UPI0007DCBD5B|nr:peroxiredoxin [Cyanobium sp. NIES-981]SBO42185.1 Alkyl hydroperoxide reductase/ Thiol specific antioxidant/ Mal allergens family protein [Cyanobium sp. NIES-981]
MKRRDLLRLTTVSAGSLLLGLLGRPRQALALGGTLPALGQPAPAFRLSGVVPAADGSAVPGELALGDFAGQWLVLYFYPRDFTGGCTLEARGFQRDLAHFQEAGAAVVGVSADDADSHTEFCSSEGLAFPLLSDPGGRVSESYGSWIAPFSQRHTFLIDPKGVLRERWVAVRPSGHSTEVLDALQKQQALQA